jgi:hypothetical protein
LASAPVQNEVFADLARNLRGGAFAAEQDVALMPERKTK